jgi:hypothetical protein
VAPDADEAISLLLVLLFIFISTSQKESQQLCRQPVLFWKADAKTSLVCVFNSSVYLWCVFLPFCRFLFPINTVEWRVFSLSSCLRSSERNPFACRTLSSRSEAPRGGVVGAVCDLIIHSRRGSSGQRKAENA